MTVIAYKDGVMAADREQGSQWLRNGRARKIGIIRGHLVGCSGNAALCHMWRDWFGRGADPNDFPKEISDDSDGVHALAVDSGGNINFYQRYPYPMPVTIGYAACGSGIEVASAIMHIGLSAQRAVEVCNEICQGCGGGVDTLTLEELRAAT